MMSGTIRTKSDVDRHVNQLLLKVRNENERNLRCYHIAQLYFKIQDFTSARHYIQLYLTVRDDSAAAHKLLGQCFEQLGKKREAIAAYTKSLKIEADQSDLILKMCELLCDKECDLDSGLARYWWERASALFPHSPPVFKLKEKIMSTDTNISSTDYEDLLHAELMARPADITVRTKLLKLYAETGRSEAALVNAFGVESRQIHGKSIEWYQCVNEICNIHFRESYAKCGWEFYVQWLSTLDKLCSLSLSEVSSSGSDLAQATNAVFSLDQKIFKATNHITEGSELYQEFMKYVSAQLVFYMGVLLMKLAKKDISLWKEIKRWLGPLFLSATTESPSMDKVCSLSIKDGHRKQLNGWIHQANCRLVQAGYILKALSKDTQSEKLFIDRINHHTSGDWRRQVFEKVFRSVDDCNSQVSSSYFVNMIEFSKLTQKFPSNNQLKPALFISSFENIYLGSLHHLVWLGLQSLESPFSILNAKIPKSFHSKSFTSLQFTVNNLNNVGVETINQLDVDSFLYATVFCTGVILEEQKANGFYPLDRPSVFPVDISPPLCSAEQSKWWGSVWSLVKSGSGGGGQLGQTNNETISDLRHTVQRGLEVVRGQGLSLPLMILLARTVANRGSGSDRNEEVEGCESRALHLWEMALPMLERLASNKTVIAMTEKKIIFEYPAKDLTPEEVSALIEEGKYFVARHYMNKQQYEKAVDVFKSLKSPHAGFCLALIYQKLAEEQTKGQNGENLTSEMRCRYVVHATKARNCLTSVREMIKTDPSHPLHPELKGKMAEVEDMLARVQPDNGNYEGDGNCVDGNGSCGSVGSGGDMARVHGISSIHHPTTRTAFPHSTPKKYFEQKHSRLNTSEIIELLNVTQSTNQLKISQVLEQSRLVLDKLENVMYEQRNQFRSLTNRFNSFETDMKNSIAEMKKELKQRSDLYNVLEEDDYTDEILQYQNYPGHNFYPAPAQARAMPSTSATVPLAAPQYFSPPMYQGNLGFYNQGALPFGDGQQQLPDFLRASAGGQQQVVQKPLQPLINLQGPLNLGQAGAGVLGGHPKLPLAAPHNVVITTSDTLPTGAPAIQPTLSVTIPAHHRLGTLPPPQVPVSLPPSFPSVPSSLPPSSITSMVPHNFQIPLPAEQPKTPSSSLSLVLNASEERSREEDELPSATYDPLPDFQPIVPLPDEVEVRTGEEGEEVVFERRAKLFRFVGTEWKERGIGNLKILKHKDTGKARILMRREQVHKICANHFLTSDMILEPKSNSENAWIWVAHDYADEKVEVEKFCVKFKTSDDSVSFKETFDKVKMESSKTPSQAVESKRMETAATTAAPGTPLFSFSQTKQPLLSTPLSQAGSVGGTPSSTEVTYTAKPPSNQKSIFSIPTDTPKTQTDQKVGKDPPVFDQGKTKIGGFSFSLSQPKFKVPEVQETKPETTKPSPFSSFSFPLSKTDSSTSQNPFANIGKIVDDKKNTTGFSFSFNSSVDKGGIFDLGKTSSLFSSPKTDVIQSKSDSKVAEKEIPNAKNDSIGHEDDFVPTAVFKPVVELPQLVPVVTGEENETVLYEEQAKLYRYCKETKQWKERGFGKMKILKNPETGVVRLVMRRDQVHKVCCNHRLTKDLDFSLLATSDKAYKWATTDHSEDEPKAEIFSIKFKTCEKAEEFKSAIENAKVDLSASLGESPKKAEEVRSSGPIQVKHPEGSWECKDCYVRNSPNVTTCEACSSPKPGATNPTQSVTPKISQSFNFGVSFTPQNGEKPLLSVKHPEGSWECKICYVRNGPDIVTCGACSSPKPGATTGASEVSTPKTLGSFNFGVPFTPQSVEKSQLTVKHPEGSWECKGCLIRNSGEVTNCPACNTAKTGSESQTESSTKFNFGLSGTGTGPAAPTYTFGIPTGSSTASTTTPSFATSTPQTAFSFGGPKNVFTFGGITATVVDSITESVPEGSSWECKKCFFWNDVADTSCSKCSAEESSAPGDKFIMPAGSAGGFTFGCAPTTPLESKSGPWECHVCFNKNKSLDANCPACGSIRPSGGPLPSSLFSNRQPPFGTPISADPNSKPGGNFGFNSSEFTFTMPIDGGTSSNNLKGNASGDESDPDAAADLEEELNVSFQPVITLPEVDLVTGEEDEEVEYCQRARLYRYDTTAKEWKERGLGNVKILRHKETGKLRLLMRRETVMKLCLNHYLTDDIVLQPKVNDDKAWVWYAADFSEGVQTSENFAIRFKTPELAQKFKEAVDEAKAQLSGPTKKDVSVEKEGGEKKSGSASEEDSDLEVVYEQKVAPELVEKALSLQLPRNFYSYLEAPPCPGCSGCDKDEDQEDQPTKITTSTDTPKDKAEEVVPVSSAPTTASSIFAAPSENSKSTAQKDSRPFANLFGSIQLQDASQPVSSSASLFGPSQFAVQSAGFTFAQKTNSDSPVNNNTPFFQGKSSFFDSNTSSGNIFGGVAVGGSEASKNLASQTPSDKPQEGLATQQTKQILKQSVLNNIASGALSITPMKSNDTQKDKPLGSKEMPQNSIFGSSNPLFASNTPTFASVAASKGATDSSKEMPPALFGSNMPSFASLATSSSPLLSGSSPDKKPPNEFKWEGANSKLFSNIGRKEVTSKNDSKNEEDKDGDEEEEVEEEERDEPHFEPLIPLPDKIELKTGEEDELPLFDERAKLYRFDNSSKVWKERGVGNMKILKNKNSNVYRLLMRREQVFKIVCNHLIKPDFELKKMSTKDDAFCWSAMNFAQDYETPQMENLSIRFKNVEIAKRFQGIIDECILTLKKDAEVGAE